MRPVDLPPLIVIPALNEVASIARVVADTRTHLPAATVLVVDDGSTDGTAAAARAAGAIVVRHAFNIGVGGAVRTGMRYARETGHGIVVQIDGDGQHPPAATQSLLDAVRDGADIAVGSRFASEDDDYKVSLPRSVAMGILRWHVRRFAGVSVPDVTSGFRAFGPRAQELLADRYPIEYLSDTVEVLHLAGRAGLRVEAVAVTMRERATGAPSHGWFRSMLYLGRVIMLLMTLAGRGSASRSTP